MPIKVDIDLLNKFGINLVNDTRTSLDSNGSTASGKTKDSLRFETTPNSFKFYGRAFINTLEVGRKKTSVEGGDGSLRAAILQWIKDKPIIPKDGMTEESLSWAISTKMHKEGDLLKRTGANHQGKTSPTEIIYGSINDGRLEELKKSLLLNVVTQIRKELKDAYSSND